MEKSSFCGDFCLSLIENRSTESPFFSLRKGNKQNANSHSMKQGGMTMTTIRVNNDEQKLTNKQV